MAANRAGLQHQSLGGAHGSLAVRWMQVGHEIQELRPKVGPPLGSVRFDGQSACWRGEVVSCHGVLSTDLVPVQTEAAARALVEDRIRHASFNPLWVPALDGRLGPSCDMKPATAARHAYALEWGDRIGMAINKATGQANRRVVASQHTLDYCVTEIQRHVRGGVFSPNTMETDRLLRLWMLADSIMRDDPRPWPQLIGRDLKDVMVATAKLKVGFM
jgi:hypothetical protein